MLVITSAVRHYGAELTAGALKVSESRIIADLLLRGDASEEWHETLYKQNALQARNLETARRLGRLIRQRLELMNADLWRLVRDGSKTVATHACLAAAIKHSALLGDFLDLVVREQYRLFASTLSPTLWEEYLNDCRGRDPVMPLWNDSTRRRLRSSPVGSPFGAFAAPSARGSASEGSMGLRIIYALCRISGNVAGWVGRSRTRAAIGSSDIARRMTNPRPVTVRQE